MTNNISVKVTAEIVDLQAKFAVAKAESQALTSELNKLARQAASDGMTDSLRSQLTAAAEKATIAKSKVADLGKEIKDATPHVQGLGAAFGELNKIAGEVGIGLGIGALIEFARATVESAAHIAHEAEVLNMTTTAYQAFTEAARTAGVETDTVDRSIRKFNTSLGAAQKGTGEQADALRDLHVNAFLPVEEALPAVARGLLGMTDLSKRARIETELFGKAGAELTPALKEWAKGSDAVAAEMRAMGLVMSPGVTEQMHQMEISGTTAIHKIGVAAATSLGFIIESWKDWAKGGVGIPDMPHDVKPFKPVGHDYDVDLMAANALADSLDKNRVAAKQLESEIDQLEKAKKGLFVKPEEAAKFDDAIAIAKRQLAELNNKSAYAGTGFSGAGEKAIAEAREQVAAIAADSTRGARERLTAEQAVWQQTLSGSKLNAAQRLSVQEQMNRAMASANKEISREQDQITQSDLHTNLELARQEYEQKKAYLEEEVAAGRMSEVEKISDLSEMLRRQEALELEAVSVAERGYAEDTAKFREYENQKLIIKAQSSAKMEQLAREGVIAQTRDQFNLKQEILSSERSLVSDIFSGRKTLGQMLRDVGLRMAQDYVTAKLEELTKHILIEQMKSAATIAGEEVRVTAKKGALAEGMATDVAAGSMQIMNDAMKAGAGAYSAVVGIPVVGPFLAPVAAATAFTAVAAFDALSSFDIGTNFVPHDMVAKVHQGERIIPKAENAELMQAVRSGRGAGGGVPDVHVSIHTIDTASMQDFMNRNARFFCKTVADAWAMNPSLRPTT